MIQARHLNTGSPLIPSCAAIKSRLPTKSHQEFNDNLQALIDVALRAIPSAPYIDTTGPWRFGQHWE